MNGHAQQKLYEAEMGEDALARQKRAAAPKCKSCGQAILWVKTREGKHMPVDYDPHEGGNILVWPDGRSQVVAPASTPATGATLHYSHFATCPHASSHRRSR